MSDYDKDSPGDSTPIGLDFNGSTPPLRDDDDAAGVTMPSSGQIKRVIVTSVQSNLPTGPLAPDATYTINDCNLSGTLGSTPVNAGLPTPIYVGIWLH